MSRVMCYEVAVVLVAVAVATAGISWRARDVNKQQRTRQSTRMFNYSRVNYDS